MGACPVVDGFVTRLEQRLYLVAIPGLFEESLEEALRCKREVRPSTQRRLHCLKESLKYLEKNLWRTWKHYELRCKQARAFIQENPSLEEPGALLRLKALIHDVKKTARIDATEEQLTINNSIRGTLAENFIYMLDHFSKMVDAEIEKAPGEQIGELFFATSEYGHIGLYEICRKTLPDLCAVHD